MNFEKIQMELDYYQKFAPVNFAEERTTFFEYLKKNQPYNPLFRYNDRLEIKDYEEIKKSIKNERGKDVIINAFLKIFLDIADMMIAWKKNNYQEISILSGKLFGSLNEFDLQSAMEVYKDLRALRQPSKDMYNDRQIKTRFLEELKRRNLKGWRIEFNIANGGNVSIYETEKKVVIRTGATDSKLGLECVLSHELDGHAFQAFNAMTNKKYSKWFLSYLGTEKQYEGYAIFTELNILSIAHINCELEYFSGLMIATGLAQRSSFYETYKAIYELCGDKDFSFLAAYKAKRGFQDTSQTGCFQKENAYLLGAIENIKLVEENKENYYRLSQGCFPLSIIEHITNKRPKWESVLAFDQENLAYFKNIMNRMMK